MMNTETDRRAAQLALEEQLVTMGIQRYRDELAKGGDLATPVGTRLLRAVIGPTSAAIEGWLEENRKGLASRNAGVFYFIDQFEPDVLAFVTARAVMSNLAERHPLARVATMVAQDLEAHLNITSITEKEPALAAKMSRKAGTYNNERSRAVFIRRGAKLADVKVIQWEPQTRVRVGTQLISLMAESTELVAIETTGVMRGKSWTIVRPTEACMKWLEENHARCELLSPLRMPMVCKPRDWTNPFNGGYLTKALREPIVKSFNRAYLTELKEHRMDWVYAAINALQATEWAVNEAVYGVIKAMFEGNMTAGVLPEREPLSLPAKPWAEGEEPDPEVLQAWKVEAARTHERNNKLLSKRLQLVDKLWVSEQMMAHGNRFHFVYTMDWRGRIYPTGKGLTPQGDDVAKALLQFAKGTPLGETGAYWLAVHGANSFGVDKVAFEERIQWVEEHTDLILGCAEDPLAQTWWCDADSPFVFLAFCFEWAKLQQHVNAGLPEGLFMSHLAVAFDGACNGLQNFSAMLLDEVGGKATGLIPGERPADIYSEVARAAQSIIDNDAANGNEQAQRWVGKMTRKLAKRNTMTVPYGVTRRGMRDQLFAELDDVEPEFRGKDAMYLASCNYEAIGQVVVAARRAMEWLREVAKVVSRAKLPVRWVAPSGLLVNQEYRERIGKEADFVLSGKRFRLMIEQDGSKLDTRKQSLGISPNFVHSLDASHLVRTVLYCVQDGITDFAMIHDSYGVPAGQASRLRDNLRQAFVDQYKEPVLAQFRQQMVDLLTREGHAELAAEIPALPETGTLDLDAVLESEYFFA